ncbi:MAG: hypothetical protein E6614_25385 [Bradyrhizobium sp.]|jgi:hypothetical protein|uniref:hypothetical protein n=1 Tax=Bradyrhizobium TaxID=374 RepID=UPI001556EB36|nr:MULTISPECIES: hypothetical protein [unclassified Bradyrhizobium]MDU0960477.1 hypothetical protein [Bradyrhizobium sp.]MDU1493733.1 hypothetical protein [Bradyrhizobium sp.]MDU1543974.1 hypothetical protein [Bradyrhizobium sp.]MDU1691808.1 hypothetical protein [Bradyrhizobium sp.]MDU1804841.1 hypothetical protein [Bradyrhizobium sp.]
MRFGAIPVELEPRDSLPEQIIETGDVILDHLVKALQFFVRFGDLGLDGEKRQSTNRLFRLSLPNTEARLAVNRSRLIGRSIKWVVTR